MLWFNFILTFLLLCFLGGLKFSCELVFAHHFVRVWKRDCNNINWCDALFYLVLFWTYTWFRNIRTLRMLMSYFIMIFFYVFLLNFVFVFWMFRSNDCFGFRASPLLMFNELWCNLVLRIFVFFESFKFSLDFCLFHKKW